MILYSRVTRGSKGTTVKLTSVQHKAAKHITGALSLAAADTLNAHAHILPIDLLFHKVLFRATARIFTLLHIAALKFVKSHKSLLHYLFHLSGLQPNNTETITSICRHHNYQAPHSTHIEGSKDDTLCAVQAINNTAAVRVYVDGSGYKAGMGASAVLYEGTKVRVVQHYYLGSAKQYTAHNGEDVSIIMGLHLPLSFTHHLIGPTIIGCDNQVVSNPIPATSY